MLKGKIKILDIYEYFHDCEESIFLNQEVNMHQNIKKKIDKMEYIKNFCSPKDTIKRTMSTQVSHNRVRYWQFMQLTKGLHLENIKDSHKSKRKKIQPNRCMLNGFEQALYKG